MVLLHSRKLLQVHALPFAKMQHSIPNANDLALFLLTIGTSVSCALGLQRSVEAIRVPLRIQRGSIPVRSILSQDALRELDH